MRVRILLAAVVAMTMIGPVRASACPVCFGDAQSAEVEGAKWAILFLVGLTGIVLAGIVAFAMHMRRRSRMTLGGTVHLPSPN
jgi:hypothetical protein